MLSRHRQSAHLSGEGERRLGGGVRERRLRGGVSERPLLLLLLLSLAITSRFGESRPSEACLSSAAGERAAGSSRPGLGLPLASSDMLRAAVLLLHVDDVSAATIENSSQDSCRCLGGVLRKRSWGLGRGAKSAAV